MPQFTKPEAWTTAGGLFLEGNADLVVKGDKNYLVTAGPGAGKTELLAQKACYLLETNTCKSPKKILAISFKRDAAFNLAERVKKRIGERLSKRFISMTFDAFAKDLVDRFRGGLPEDYCPFPDYIIETQYYPQSIMRIFEKYSPGSTNAFSGGERKRKRDACLHSLTATSYPLASSNVIALKVLSDMLRTPGDSILTFPIIARLAELLLKENPTIVEFLRITYSHVFLDEFQDTTTRQFDILKTIFKGGENKIIAVGDTRQRIMLWAGAMDGIFDEFMKEFVPERMSLYMNFRSAPRLIALQNHFAKTLMGSKTDCKPPVNRDEKEGVAKFWISQSVEEEAEKVANKIKLLIDEDGIAPHDICLLFKQTPEKQSITIQAALSNLGIDSRVENAVQDLIGEQVIQFLMRFIICSLEQKDTSKEREKLLSEYADFYRVYDDNSLLKTEKLLINNIKQFKEGISSADSWEVVVELIRDVLENITFQIFKSIYPQYNEQKYFDECVSVFCEKLEEYCNAGADLLSSLYKFLGKDSVPIMTIHKSKGLEFRVVFFIGFEDQNFWTYTKQPDENICAFFVAISRAMEEIHFTFSRKRVNNFGYEEQRCVDAIRPILDTLRASKILDDED